VFYKLVLMLKYHVHYMSVTEQIKIKITFILILMAETVRCVAKIICYVTCLEEKRNTHRILAENCEGMR